MAELDAAGRLPLSQALHATIRSEHASLNRTIMARLPLCLPPTTSSPALYIRGITTIGQIYYGFEEAWGSLLAEQDLDQKTKTILQQLDIPQLRRTQRLDASLDSLCRSSRSISKEQLSALQMATARFRNEIRNSIIAKPHLLMAYTWTMYLALFNGGRFIVKQLLSAGPTFWSEEDREAVVKGPLSFWFFDETKTYDGEDIKTAFKERFSFVAETLTDEEQDEVVLESKKLFGIFAEMVELLDRSAQLEMSPTEPRLNLDVGSAMSPQAKSGAGVLGYVSSLVPSAMMSTWQSLISRVPMAQTSLPISLQPAVERKV